MSIFHHSRAIDAVSIQSLRDELELERSRAEYYRAKWHNATGIPLMEVAEDVFLTPPRGLQALPQKPEYAPTVGIPPVPRDLPPHPDLPKGLH